MTNLRPTAIVVLWIGPSVVGCGADDAGEQPGTASAGSASGTGDAGSSTTATGPSTASGSGSDSGAETGPPPPTGALGEPVFDPNDPGHVLHFYDDFANYGSVAELAMQGGNPNRVGGPWTIRGEFMGDLSEPDPVSGGQSVVIRYPNVGSAGINDGGISAESGSYVAVTGSEEVVVIEYAFQELGPATFLGKFVDYNGGQGSVGRFDFNNGSAWRLGGNGSPDCATDLLCPRYYGEDDEPLLPGLPPESGHLGGSPIRYVQLRTDGTFLPAEDPHDNVTYGYRQNRHFGTGAGQFDWMTNRDMSGRGTPPTQMPWMVIKERFTKTPSMAVYGGGRIEHFIGETPGALTKVIEYVGDPGAHDEGVVFVGPADRSLLGPNLNIMWPQGLGSPADTNVRFGYVRVWSHPRQEL